MKKLYIRGLLDSRIHFYKVKITRGDQLANRYLGPITARKGRICRISGRRIIDEALHCRLG